MWGQFLFWAMAGPKQLQRFLLLWLILIGVFFYALVEESSDRQPDAAGLPGARVPTSAHR